MILVTLVVAHEAAHFAFRYACDDCVHFAERTEACSLGYPGAPRRGALRLPSAWKLITNQSGGRCLKKDGA